MQKTRTEKYEVEDTIHEFYCDECNKYLGESTEYEDGYYEKYGEYEVSFFMKPTQTWYRLKKCLCDKHYDAFNSKIITELSKLGFEADH